MGWYLSLKLIHILSATLILGTGLGTAYYMWRADSTRNVHVIADVAHHVVRADWYFVAPAVVIQPVTGYLLSRISGTPLDSSWLVVSLALYLLIGACWLPVLWIQWRVATDARTAADAGGPLPETHWRYMRWWYGLGWPAFFGVVVIFFLMVFKPALW
jgi:uncharacterized membrane protein